MNEDAETVVLRFTKSQAEEISHGLSDLLCWAIGFNAALSEGDYQRSPLGVEEARTLNIKLKEAMK